MDGGPELALGEPGEGLADDLAKKNVVLDKKKESKERFKETRSAMAGPLVLASATHTSRCV